MSAFTDQLWPNLIGSGFGVGLALFVDRWTESRRRAGERKKARRDREERSAAQLRIVQWLTDENLELARQAVEALDSGGMFVFRMNTHLLDAALVELSTLCDDQELLWKAEHLRYQLHHVNEKIAAFVSSAIFQGTPTASGRRFLKEQIVPSLRAQLVDQIVPAGEALSAELSRGIQTLSMIQRPPVRPQLPSPSHVPIGFPTDQR